MFTGITEETGFIKSFDGHTLVVECKVILDDIKIGDSVSVDGCCQTVVSLSPNSFVTNVSSETLKITKGFNVGTKVNLERALTLSSRMGGHIVQGHIDGTAIYLGDYTFKVTDDLLKYIVYKGSITVNGISLTVSNVRQDKFGVAIIPHTFENTTFKYLKIGDKVNIETDILGRYVENFLSWKNNIIDENFLSENGFV